MLPARHFPLATSRLPLPTYTSVLPVRCLATFATTDSILAMRPIAAVVALILLVCPASARALTPGPSPEGRGESDASGNAAYEKLAAEAIDASLAWRPLDATNAGLHDYDGRLPDYSPAAIFAGSTGCWRAAPSWRPSTRNRCPPATVTTGRSCWRGCAAICSGDARFATISATRCPISRTLRSSSSRNSRHRPSE